MRISWGVSASHFACAAALATVVITAGTACAQFEYDDVFWPEACFAYTDQDACIDYYCSSYWDIDGFSSYYGCLVDPFAYINPYEDVLWPDDCSLYEATELCLNYYCALYWDIDGHFSYASCLADPFITISDSSPYDDVFWPEACFAYTDQDACIDYYCSSYWDIDGFSSYYGCLVDPFAYINPYEDVLWPDDCSLYEATELCLNYYCALYWDIDGHFSYASCLADPFITISDSSPYDDVFWPEACFAYTDQDACIDYYCSSYWDIDGFSSYYGCLVDPFAYVLSEELLLTENNAAVETDQLLYVPGETVHLTGSHGLQYTGLVEISITGEDDLHVVDEISASASNGFFSADVYVDSNYLPGNYYVLVHDNTGNLVTSTFFAVLGIGQHEMITPPSVPPIENNIVVKYEDTSDSYHGQIKNWLEFNEHKVVNQAAITDYLVLPRDIPVSFEMCDVENAFYHPATSSITMCYELAAHYISEFRNVYGDDDELTASVFGALHWVFLHELGHALIDIYDIPITGKEEDSADQFATHMALRQGDTGLNALLSMLYLYGSSESSSIEWGVHSSDKQRYYSILCTIYGSDPEVYGFLVDDGLLPESRAVYCTDEYEKTIRSWSRLLADYIRG